MSWEDVEMTLENGAGTFISEYLAMKGPVRLWWTPADVHTLSPVPYQLTDDGPYDPAFAAFSAWCYAAFTSGTRTGRLIAIPDRLSKEQRKHLNERLRGARHVLAYSFLRTQEPDARIKPS